MKIHPTYFIILTSCSLYAQISGKVTAPYGEPLPFAAVYVQGTTIGTTTNNDGEYLLKLENGKHELVFQYVGYRQKVEEIELKGKPVRLDVQLTPEVLNLAEVEVKANAEDPAYAIIRKAIAKRKYYSELVRSYACDVYIKGNVQILDAPEKIFGREIGDMEGSLDSTRQGIVYLSESVSKLYFQQPGRFKEVMVSSKVSGNDNGFSFNSAQDMRIDLNENFIPFGRNIISPIADGAMGYYRYKYHGVSIDESGLFINKIEVIPKNNEDPVFRGFIYIIDELWNIHSADLLLTGKVIQQPLFDTFYIRQTHVPVKAPEIWRQFSQTFTFSGGLFGFKFGGSFTGIYSNYELEQVFAPGFFGNEIMKVEKGANEKDTSYWNFTRPIPLLEIERKDYQKKDSLQIIHQSKPYLDSLDKVNNRFKVNNLLLGYTMTNSWLGQSFIFESPINTVQFNSVQGYNLYVGLGYRKNYDKDNLRWFETRLQFSYGFSEKMPRVAGELTYNFNRTDFSRLTLSGGKKVTQFNEDGPISKATNTFYTTFFRRNYIKLFDKAFFRVDYRRELMNGLFFRGFMEWQDRSPLDNHSSFSFFYSGSREIASNYPMNNHIAEGDLGKSSALQAGFSLRIRFNQKYLSYPDRKYIMGSKYPDILFQYRHGFYVEKSGVNYDVISMSIHKNDVTVGLGGSFSFHAETGKFLNTRKLFFQDYHHFTGNETNLGNPGKYLRSFKMLPYYSFSTKSDWVEVHLEHNFRGFLTDKLPLFKKLGWNLVAGGGYLFTKEENSYWEFSLGFDNIGFGVLRLFRFDVVNAYDNKGHKGTGYLIGLNLPVNDSSLQ